ncbi:MAG: ATP-dependent Clp protease proteolytic subunit [Myxococcota bacterium]
MNRALLCLVAGPVLILTAPILAHGADEAERERIEGEQAVEEARAAIERAKTDRSLSGLEEKKRRAELEAELLEQQRKLELNKLQAKKEQLELRGEIAELEAKLADASLARTKKRLELEAEKLNHEASIALAALELEAKTLEMKNDALEQKVRSGELALQKQRSSYELESSRLINELSKMQVKRERIEDDLTRLETKLAIRERQDELDRRVASGVAYTLEPYNNGVLRVSDRRIPLNGPIIEGTADYVTRRLHFFNNKSSSQPIFIVIDRSPGGSVMEGYRILKAMEASEAPLHVVVKSFAASMAAVILTLAEHSYAYPNAIILHHQPMSGNRGNLREQEEELEVFREWAKRLHTPVAKRMGISLKEFYARMYKNDTRGDWEEFADRARSVKWVDHIVTEIREEGYEVEPEGEAPRPSLWWFFARDGQESDGAGPRRVPPNGYSGNVRLPPPAPFDFYFLYNRQERYSW